MSHEARLDNFLLTCKNDSSNLPATFLPAEKLPRRLDFLAIAEIRNAHARRLGFGRFVHPLALAQVLKDYQFEKTVLVYGFLQRFLLVLERQVGSPRFVEIIHLGTGGGIGAVVGTAAGEYLVAALAGQTEVELAPGPEIAVGVVPAGEIAVGAVLAG